MNDAEIEKEIQEKKLTAPRVTPEQLEAVIAGEYYIHGDAYYYRNDGIPDHPPLEHMRALACLTICVLVLRNGFTVTGESACASPENFNAERGRKVAREHAKQKIWPLEGYLLKQMLHEAKIKGDNA